MAAMSRSQKVRLGIFVGTGLTLLLAAFVVLAGRALVERRDEYLIRFENKGASFSGLEIGSDVTYSGIAIGRVDQLGIAKENVGVIEVTISTKAGVPIAEDSSATLVAKGITGLKFIDLSRGSAKARVRKPGETIPAGQSIVEELTEKATSVVEKLEVLLVNIQGLTGSDTQESVQKILGDTSGILTDNRAQVESIISHADVVVKDLAVVSQRGVAIADKADVFMAQLTSVGGQLKAELGAEGELTRVVAQSAELVARVNMLVLRSEGDLDVTLQNLRETSANLSDFSVAVKENPSLLINNPKVEDNVGR